MEPGTESSDRPTVAGLDAIAGPAPKETNKAAKRDSRIPLSIFAGTILGYT
jgi:hypothetical protein